MKLAAHEARESTGAIAVCVGVYEGEEAREVLVQDAVQDRAPWLAALVDASGSSKEADRAYPSRSGRRAAHGTPLCER